MTDKPNTKSPPVKSWAKTFETIKDIKPHFEAWVWKRIPIEVVSFYKNDARKN